MMKFLLTSLFLRVSFLFQRLSLFFFSWVKSFLYL